MRRTTSAALCKGRVSEPSRSSIRVDSRSLGHAIQEAVAQPYSPLHFGSVPPVVVLQNRRSAKNNTGGITVIQRSKPIRRTPLKKRRTKPRPGRVTGKAMEALRRACFERDGYRCQHQAFIADTNCLHARCMRLVTWDNGHMAHIKSRGAGGKDELSNVTTKCPDCHVVREHFFGPSGIKPVPPKPR